MCSTEPVFNSAQRCQLLEVAGLSIQTGLRERHAFQPDPADYDGALHRNLASFVTLTIDGQLRGCIGHLEAIQPLITDVAENAYSAAFQDSRFPPLSAAESDILEIHVSVLSRPQSMSFSSERDLLQQIRPGTDGLILQDGYHQGTFLPSVWEQLPDKEVFFTHLKNKAGLPSDYWSDNIRVSRYTTESFSDALPCP
jgi:AmmeMemoRadiSam system protein A